MEKSWLRSIDLIIYKKDGTDEELTISAPNGRAPIFFSEVYTGSPIFRDAGRSWRKGSRFSRAKFVLNYQSNYIPKNKLLESEFIEVKFNGINPPFLNRIFRFENTSVKKHWMASTPLTQDGSTIEDANPIPDGSASFEFLSVGFFQRSSYYDDYYDPYDYPDPDPDPDPQLEPPENFNMEEI